MPKVISANPGGLDEQARSERDQKAVAIHSLRDSMIRNKPLTGRVSAINHSDEADYVIVIYEGVHVVIPLEKMGFTEKAMESKHRANVTANSMAGAEIDFIVEHVDQERGAATASRVAAMKQKARDFYVGDGDREAIVKEGSLVEARIIGVMDYSLRLEIFGIEKYVKSRDLNRKWISDCRDHYEVGGTIVMRVLKIVKDEAGNVKDVEVEGANLHEPFKTTCTVGGRYTGEITGYSDGRYFIHLDNGSNAIAHTNAAMGYMPKRKDLVAFVPTRILDDKQSADVAGKVVRVIRRYTGN